MYRIKETFKIDGTKNMCKKISSEIEIVAKRASPPKLPSLLLLLLLLNKYYYTL